MTRTERRMRPRYEQARPVGFTRYDLFELVGLTLACAVIVFGIPMALVIFVGAL